MRLSYASRYIPDNAVMLEHPDGLGTVYAYTTRNAKPAAVAYAGKQSKAAWHFSFPNEARRDERVREFFQSLESHRQLKAERRENRKLPHSYKVGDIVSNSWGYDQTNVDWYQVVKTSANFVWLRGLAADVTATGNMCGQSRPEPGNFLKGEPEQHRVEVSVNSKGERSEYVHFEYGCGSKWDGQSSRYNSWYA